MSDQHEDHERRGFPWVATFFAALPVLYVLSYAPYVRCFGGLLVPGHHGPVGGGEIAIYRPVDWIIDNTPLREPLMKWAESNGVHNDFEASYVHRHLLRRISEVQ